MGFSTLDTSEKSFRIIEQHILNEDGFTPEFTLLDFRTVTPYYFSCTSCDRSTGHIGHDDAKTFSNQKFRIDSASLQEFGGPGTISKLINCDHCHTTFFVGIGYMEPNYGRDVFVLHSILELEEITLE